MLADGKVAARLRQLFGSYFFGFVGFFLLEGEDYFVKLADKR